MTRNEESAKEKLELEVLEKPVDMAAGPGKGHFFAGKKSGKGKGDDMQGKCNSSCSGSCK